MLKPKPQCDDIWRWGPLEVIRSWGWCSQMWFCFSIWGFLLEAQGLVQLICRQPKMSGNPTPMRNESWWINCPVSSFIGDTILKYNVVSQEIPRGTEPQLSTLATHSLMLAYFFGFLLFSRFPTASLMLSGHLSNKIPVVISLSQSLLLGKFKLKKPFFLH